MRNHAAAPMAAASTGPATPSTMVSRCTRLGQRCGARRDDTDDLLADGAAHRASQQPGVLADAGDGTIDDHLPASCSRQLVGRQHGLHARRREDVTGRTHHLGDDGARLGRDRLGVQAGREVVGPDRQLVGDRSAERAADVSIEEQRADAEDEHRPGGGE